MNAIFEDGSRQYRVSEGDVVTVDYRHVDAGTTVEFTNVLLCSKDGDVKIGAPMLVGAKIVGEVVKHPSIKTYIQKFRRRKGYRRLTGHRQPYTAVKITQIVV